MSFLLIGVEVGGNRHSIDYADNYNDVHWNNYSSAKLCKAGEGVPSVMATYMGWCSGMMSLTGTAI